MPGFQDFVLPFGGNTNINYSSQAAPAYANMFGAFPQSLANIYGSGSQAFTGYGQGLAGQSNAQAQNYGSYTGALGNLSQAYANQASARYGANAMAEAARQGAVANIGSAALGSYGNIGGQALQAWAQNQAAYNKALSDMTAANQYSTSQLGQSRNSALAGLGGAYAQAAAGLSPATLASDVAFNFSDSGGGGGFGGGGFSATGPDGGIGSGSFGGGGGGGGGGMNFSGTKTSRPGNIQQIVDATYGGLGNIASSINDDRAFGALGGGYGRAMESLNSQHYSSREMPGQMMDKGLVGLMTLGDQAYGNSSRGMDQFYGEMDRSYDPRMYGQIADMLTGGYQDSSGRVSGNAASLTKGWDDNKDQYKSATAGVGSILDRLTGANPAAAPQPASPSSYVDTRNMTPSEWALYQARAQRNIREREASAKRSLGSAALL